MNKGTGSAFEKHVKGRPWSFLLPALIILAVLAIVPLIHAVSISLHSINIRMPQLGRDFVGLKNFVRVVTTARSTEAFFRTFLFLLLTIVPELILGLIISWTISRGTSIYERSWITVLLVLPMAIPRVVGGLIWKVLYDPIVGPIDFLLSLVGISAPIWLGDPRIALASIAIVDIWQWTPFMILILLSGIEGQPIQIFEAASVDGANNFTLYFRIILPLLKPFITIAVLFRSLDAMRTFDYVFTLTQGGPGRVTETVDVFAYSVGISESGDISFGSAAALVLLLFTVVASSYWSKVMQWGAGE